MAAWTGSERGGSAGMHRGFDMQWSGARRSDALAGFICAPSSLPLQKALTCYLLFSLFAFRFFSFTPLIFGIFHISPKALDISKLFGIFFSFTK